ncbi:MAG: starch-binding protein [Muribaculaceae bacterium]|nr:starch-binding protein [Muribaculaceae bacterium]
MKKFKGLVAGAALAATAFSGMAAGTFIGGRNDFRDETIYFAMTTRFYDGDHSNNTYCWDGVNNVNDPEWRGDFKGLIEKLDYIKALGFTAIWITPVVENASGLDYHGYHAFDFKKVDPRYESQDVKFQTLIDAVHERGMKLILDIVLQHTGNFGEETLCPMFVKDYNMPMSNINKSMKLHPNSKLPSNYYSLEPGEQYSHRLGLMKNTRGVNQDVHNYWHHYAHFNWDNASRWWGQIAGDCVDLNTENPATSNYIVNCYSNFIKMGVDGFRIDTSGHIARLTFNNAFIPQLHEAAKSAEAIAKRGNTPFYMFGEVCARAEEVIYRDGDYNCSPCFYTWKEEKDYPWDYSETSWDNYVVMEGETGEHVNAKSVLQQGEDYTGKSKIRHSNNAWLNGNEYHTPDYTDNSGFNVIDFPMHWRFHNAENAFGVRSQDDYYNDATWNVVYVDGHDYGPNGWDTKSFGGSLNQWAENLSLMFTFRGIPCIWQGTETNFRKGVIIDKGAIEPLKNTARAYYGGYLTGSVNTTDFAEYSNATGNLAASLSHPLALHLQRLNKIRAAVPALRKGQYSTEGCSGKLAFKRRYKDDNTDSYALVTVSGDASFTGVLNGTYKDVITGDVKTVNDGKLSVKCSGQGNIRVYVLNGPGKIGEDGQYLYGTSPVTRTQLPYDGNEEAGDTETKRDNEPYDPAATPNVTFSPDGGSFSTETLTVTATLRNNANSGSFKVGNNATVSLAKGETKTFTIGDGMAYGDNVTVTWTADEYSGSVVFTKIDPNAAQVVYFLNSDNWGAVNAYCWDDNHREGNAFSGAWPGVALSETAVFSNVHPDVDGKTLYKYTLTSVADLKNPMIIFNGNGKQTPDLKFVANGIYSFNQSGTEPFAFAATGVSEVAAADDAIMVYAQGGNLVIESASACTVNAVRLDGTVRTLNVAEGLNYYELPKGFYIVAGKKVII